MARDPNSLAFGLRELSFKTKTKLKGKPQEACFLEKVVEKPNFRTLLDPHRSFVAEWPNPASRVPLESFLSGRSTARYRAVLK